MKYQFANNIITNVPTCCLVEDYQMLQKAINHKDWEWVECVRDCLEDSIDRYTTVPQNLHITPSSRSLIAMSCHSGIITDEFGNDILCAAERPVSEGCDPENCVHCQQHKCDPEKGFILLKGNFLYEPGCLNDEKLLNFLDNFYQTEIGFHFDEENGRFQFKNQAEENHMLAFADMLSEKLQENGFEDASKYLDALLEL